MITTKSPQELEYMREAGRIVALAHEAIQPYLVEGTTTEQINQICEETILKHHATPSFKGLYGFSAAVCTSINSTLVHGVPDDTKLKNGDIISVDIGACYKGYHGDSAWTYAIGEVDEKTKELMKVTHDALFVGLSYAKAGNHLSDISHAIGEYVISHGFSIPTGYTGHGIGTEVHEDPSIPNFGPAGRGVILTEGMTIAVEPMVHMGKPQTRILKDGWSVVSRDGSNTAHYEHTIAITKNGYEILTTLNKEELQNNG